MTTNTRLISNSDQGIVYTTPGSVNGYRLTFKSSKSTKDAGGGLKVPNHRLEILSNMNSTVSMKGTDCTTKCGQESLSVRLIVSGSPLNKAQLDAMVEALCTQGIKWFKQEYVFDGFEPTTLPIDPTISATV